MIQTPPINKNNLVRWYQVTTPTTIDTSTYFTELTNGYQLRWRDVQDYLPILVGDTFTIYTNFSTNIVGGGDSVVVVEEDTCGSYTIISDPTEYVIADEAWGTNNNKITLNIPVTNTKINKKFRLAIIDGLSEIQYVTNCFRVSPLLEKNVNNTHLLEYYHLSNTYDYEWADFDPLTDTPYTVRISGSKINVDYPSTKSIYQEATTGRPRVTRAVNQKTYEFELYYNVEEFFDALSLIVNSKKFMLNTNEYIVDSLKPSYERNFNLFKGVIELKDVNYDKRVNIC